MRLVTEWIVLVTIIFVPNALVIGSIAQAMTLTNAPCRLYRLRLVWGLLAGIAFFIGTLQSQFLPKIIKSFGDTVVIRNPGDIAILWFFRCLMVVTALALPLWSFSIRQHFSTVILSGHNRPLFHFFSSKYFAAERAAMAPSPAEMTICL